MGSYNGLLKAEHFPPNRWKLSRLLTLSTDQLTDQDIKYIKDIGVDCTNTGTISVKSGFETDLASVPRILWTLISPWDIARAAVVHDEIYSHCRNYCKSESFEKLIWKNTRKVADKIFLIAMNSSEPPIPEWKKKSAYYAVRFFGAKAASEMKE